jgi:mannose-6-phosphate isomerase-like protein (cupin superfamily)
MGRKAKGQMGKKARRQEGKKAIEAFLCLVVDGPVPTLYTKAPRPIAPRDALPDNTTYCGGEMKAVKRSLHEEEVEASRFPDRWSKDLIGGEPVSTWSGFSLGIAEYHAEDFSLQVHDDQEALYILSGEGEVRIGSDIFQAHPGMAFYVPPQTPHATRRTGECPVRLIYAHGAI